MTLSQARLQLFLAKAYYDVAATQTAALVVLGERNGLYRELARQPLTSAELAQKSSLPLRYITSWLVNQAAAGYVTADGEKFSLNEEQAAAFTDTNTIGYLPAAFELAVGLNTQCHGDVDAAMATLAAAKAGTLLDRWLGDELRARLAAGGRVLDLGCGCGAAAIELARRYPAAEVIGVDIDDAAIEKARRAASSVRFESEWIDTRFDVVLSVESLHEMASPLQLARQVRGSLTDSGAWIIVEPMTDLQSQNSTSARLVAATDVLYCLPASPDGLGALAGEARIRDLLAEAGFSIVSRRDDGYHLVLDARG